MFRGRPLIAAAVLAVAAVGLVLVLALRGGGDHDPAPPAPPDVAGNAGSDASVSTRQLPPERLPVRAPRDASPPAAAVPLDDALLAKQPAELHGRGRHAWRLADLMGDDYWKPKHEVHVYTAGGMDFIVRGAGRTGDDVILVQRDDGTRYIGWLVAGADPEASLGDIERPAERLEDVVSVLIVAQPTREDLPPAQLEVVIDGVTVRTLMTKDVAALATASMQSKGKTVKALDLELDLGGATKVVSLVAGGASVTLEPPVAGARPVIFANRRQRFKFAWIDRSGAPILGTPQREVSKVVLRKP